VNGFKQFLLRGNVIDLAVAVVIGGAFGAIVSSFVKDLLTPLIAAVGGQPDFSGIAFEINHSKFMIGDFINAVISFLIIAAAVYYVVVLPISKVTAQFATPAPPAEPVTKKCTECLSEIPIPARRCAFCASPQPA
jgi:large conductance mechanosensitive channel